MRDRLNAFCAHTAVMIPGIGEGPLSGLTFAAKDLFDIAGFKTGAGNPDWLKTHTEAARTSPAVQTLIDAGATLIGKTITDELAYSLTGENAHYGTPVNPCAPDRIPGGSSSGSASATAGGLVDFALGTDTGGSVRVPASFCGLYGFRPTHGRIPMEGVVPLAPSFDTVGWFAREAGVLRQVGLALLVEEQDRRSKGQLIVAEDAFAIADERVQAVLQPALRAAAEAIGPINHTRLSREELESWSAQFQTIQRREAWAAHGEWIDRVHPTFGPGIGERFFKAMSVTRQQAADAQAIRQQVRAHLDSLLADGDILCLPTAPQIAPLKNSTSEVLDRFRSRALSLTCIAGLAGLPQVTLPLAEVEGTPVGLSLIAARGTDTRLLALAEIIGNA